MKKEFHIIDAKDALLYDIYLLLTQVIENQMKGTVKSIEYYDNADLKRMFNLGDKSLYRRRKEGSLPYIKIGGKIYYRADALKNLQKK